MASPDLILTAPTCEDVTLPINPFVSNRYHFGMLLGVADLDTDQGYHRGKTWLHTAWLHGYGTVWGLQAELRTGTNELAVLFFEVLDAHFRQRLERPDIGPASTILHALDGAIAALLESDPGPVRVQGLTAATGLRLGLFPSQPVAANGAAR